jgi:hypothetical protein
MPVLFRNLFIGLCLALLTSSLAGCVGSGTAGGVSIQDRDTRVDLAFSDQERHLIHDYYRRNLPPGLAKRSQLPPGLAKRSSLPPDFPANACRGSLSPGCPVSPMAMSGCG